MSRTFAEVREGLSYFQGEISRTPEQMHIFSYNLFPSRLMTIDSYVTMATILDFERNFPNLKKYI